MHSAEHLTVGTAGHTLGKVKFASKKEYEKLKLIETRGCPINGKTPTVMLERTFIKMCLQYQERANTSDTNVSIRGGHFSYNNKRLCIGCEIGKLVKENKKFEPPVGITFENVSYFKIS